jgi:hypothetical protein
MRARHRVVAVLTAALLPVLASTACADFLIYKVGSGLAALTYRER